MIVVLHHHVKLAGSYGAVIKQNFNDRWLRHINRVLIGDRPQLISLIAQNKPWSVPYYLRLLFCLEIIKGQATNSPHTGKSRPGPLDVQPKLHGY